MALSDLVLRQITWSLLSPVTLLQWQPLLAYPIRLLYNTPTLVMVFAFVTLCWIKEMAPRTTSTFFYSQMGCPLPMVQPCAQILPAVHLRLVLNTELMPQLKQMQPKHQVIELSLLMWTQLHLVHLVKLIWHLWQVLVLTLLSPTSMICNLYWTQSWRLLAALRHPR